MQVQITVGDFSTRQWDQLQEDLLTSYDVAPGVVRVCVVFGLNATTERHAEMPVRAFVGLMTRLQRIEAHAALAEAALTPDKADDPGPFCHCNHDPEQGGHPAGSEGCWQS